MLSLETIQKLNIDPNYTLKAKTINEMLQLDNYKDKILIKKIEFSFINIQQKQFSNIYKILTKFPELQHFYLHLEVVEPCQLDNTKDQFFVFLQDFLIINKIQLINFEIDYQAHFRVLMIDHQLKFYKQDDYNKDDIFTFFGLLFDKYFFRGIGVSAQQQPLSISQKENDLKQNQQKQQSKVQQPNQSQSTQQVSYSSDTAQFFISPGIDSSDDSDEDIYKHDSAWHLLLSCDNKNQENKVFCYKRINRIQISLKNQLFLHQKAFQFLYLSKEVNLKFESFCQIAQQTVEYFLWLPNAKAFDYPHLNLPEISIFRFRTGKYVLNFQLIYQFVKKFIEINGKNNNLQAFEFNFSKFFSIVMENEAHINNNGRIRIKKRINFRQESSENELWEFIQKIVELGRNKWSQNLIFQCNYEIQEQQYQQQQYENEQTELPENKQSEQKQKDDLKQSPTQETIVQALNQDQVNGNQQQTLQQLQQQQSESKQNEQNSIVKPNDEQQLNSNDNQNINYTQISENLCSQKQKVLNEMFEIIKKQQQKFDHFEFRVKKLYKVKYEALRKQLTIDLSYLQQRDGVLFEMCSQLYANIFKEATNIIIYVRDAPLLSLSSSENTNQDDKKNKNKRQIEELEKYKTETIESMQADILQFCQKIQTTKRCESFEFNAWGLFSLEIKQNVLKLSKSIEFSPKYEPKLFQYYFLLFQSNYNKYYQQDHKDSKNNIEASFQFMYYDQSHRFWTPVINILNKTDIYIHIHEDLQISNSNMEFLIKILQIYKSGVTTGLNADSFKELPQQVKGVIQNNNTNKEGELASIMNQLIEQRIFQNYELFLRGYIQINWKKFPYQSNDSSLCLNLKDEKVLQLLNNQKFILVDSNKLQKVQQQMKQEEKNQPLIFKQNVVELIFDQWEEFSNCKNSQQFQQIYDKCLFIIRSVGLCRCVKLQLRNQIINNENQFSLESILQVLCQVQAEEFSFILFQNCIDQQLKAKLIQQILLQQVQGGKEGKRVLDIFQKLEIIYKVDGKQSLLYYDTTFIENYLRILQKSRKVKVQKRITELGSLQKQILIQDQESSSHKRNSSQFEDLEDYLQLIKEENSYSKLKQDQQGLNNDEDLLIPVETGQMQEYLVQLIDQQINTQIDEGKLISYILKEDLVIGEEVMDPRQDARLSQLEIIKQGYSLFLKIGVFSDQDLGIWQKTMIFIQKQLNNNIIFGNKKLQEEKDQIKQIEVSLGLVVILPYFRKMYQITTNLVSLELEIYLDDEQKLNSNIEFNDWDRLSQDIKLLISSNDLQIFKLIIRNKFVKQQQSLSDIIRKKFYSDEIYLNRKTKESSLQILINSLQKKGLYFWILDFIKQQFAYVLSGSLKIAYEKQYFQQIYNQQEQVNNQQESQDAADQNLINQQKIELLDFSKVAFDITKLHIISYDITKKIDQIINIKEQIKHLEQYLEEFQFEDPSSYFKFIKKNKTLSCKLKTTNEFNEIFQVLLNSKFRKDIQHIQLVADFSYSKNFDFNQLSNILWQFPLRLYISMSCTLSDGPIKYIDVKKEGLIDKVKYLVSSKWSNLNKRTILFAKKIKMYYILQNIIIANLGNKAYDDLKKFII